MSEEVKSTEEASAEVQSAGDAKKKKVNQLSTDQLKKKIADMQEKNLSESRYFKHLNQRLSELESN